MSPWLLGQVISEGISCFITIGGQFYGLASWPWRLICYTSFGNKVGRASELKPINSEACRGCTDSKKKLNYRFTTSPSLSLLQLTNRRRRAIAKKKKHDHHQLTQEMIHELNKNGGVMSGAALVNGMPPPYEQQYFPQEDYDLDDAWNNDRYFTESGQKYKVRSTNTINTLTLTHSLTGVVYFTKRSQLTDHDFLQKRNTGNQSLPKL